MATGLATAINANANLTAIGVTASSSSAVLNIKSTSINNTTYTKTLSGGATETITLAPATSASQYSYNNLNELTNIAAGGATKFEATTNKAFKSATINSNPATLNWSKNFAGNASLASGSNTVPVSATDGANNIVTNNYQVVVTGPSSSNQTHDANGNMTSDGINAYAWDAENRLIKITYPGSGNYSQILCDASGIKGQITETVASTLTSTKQFVNSGTRICEERDASSAVTKKFFGRGQTIGGSNYFYDIDHLGSIRDMTDSSDVVQAHYEYDLYGQRTKTAGALDSDFQYAGYYMHAPSGLNLTVYRAYNPSLGRWINRDPIEEDGGTNLYAYVNNDSTGKSDPSGLIAGHSPGPQRPPRPPKNRNKGCPEKFYEDCTECCESNLRKKVGAGMSRGLTFEEATRFYFQDYIDCQQKCEKGIGCKPWNPPRPKPPDTKPDPGVGGTSGGGAPPPRNDGPPPDRKNNSSTQ